MSSFGELKQGKHLFHHGNETVRIVKQDDVAHVSWEPVKIVGDGPTPTTGISNAAEFIGVHVNTMRRYVDRGYVPARIHPSGHRRIPIEGLRLFQTKLLDGDFN